MIFSLSKLIRNKCELRLCINQKKFISYVNMNSFRVGGDFKHDYCYYADGKPISFLFSLLKFQRVRRLTALLIDDFWVDTLKNYTVILVGYEGGLEKSLISSNLVRGIKIDYIIHGYYPIEILKQKIEQFACMDNNVIVFIGIGQPSQEKLLSLLHPLNGKLPIVCVGAYFKQRGKLINEYFPFWDFLGLTPIIRFWNKPFTLISRTFYSLLFVPFRLKK